MCQKFINLIKKGNLWYADLSLINFKKEVVQIVKSIRQGHFST